MSSNMIESAFVKNIVGDNTTTTTTIANANNNNNETIFIPAGGSNSRPDSVDGSSTTLKTIQNSKELEAAKLEVELANAKLRTLEIEQNLKALGKGSPDVPSRPPLTRKLSVSNVTPNTTNNLPSQQQQQLYSNQILTQDSGTGTIGKKKSSKNSFGMFGGSTKKDKSGSSPSSSSFKSSSEGSKGKSRSSDCISEEGSPESNDELTNQIHQNQNVIGLELSTMLTLPPRNLDNGSGVGTPRSGNGKISQSGDFWEKQKILNESVNTSRRMSLMLGKQSGPGTPISDKCFLDDKSGTSSPSPSSSFSGKKNKSANTSQKKENDAQKPNAKIATIRKADIENEALTTSVKVIMEMLRPLAEISKQIGSIEHKSNTTSTQVEYVFEKIDDIYRIISDIAQSPNITNNAKNVDVNYITTSDKSKVQLPAWQQHAQQLKNASITQPPSVPPKKPNLSLSSSSSSPSFSSPPQLSCSDGSVVGGCNDNAGLILEMEGLIGIEKEVMTIVKNLQTSLAIMDSKISIINETCKINEQEIKDITKIIEKVYVSSNNNNNIANSNSNTANLRQQYEALGNKNNTTVTTNNNNSGGGVTTNQIRDVIIAEMDKQKTELKNTMEKNFIELKSTINIINENIKNIKEKQNGDDHCVSEKLDAIVVNMMNMDMNFQTLVQGIQIEGDEEGGEEDMNDYGS